MTDDLLLNNNHNDAALVIGGNTSNLSSMMVMNTTQSIDNDSNGGSIWIRTDSELVANTIGFNGNSLYEIVTDSINYYVEPNSSFECGQQMSGNHEALRCGLPVVAEPQYSTHLNSHVSNGIQISQC